MEYNDDIIYPMINWDTWKPLARCSRAKPDDGELNDMLDMSTKIIVEEEEPLNDIEEPAFEPRDVIIRKDVWVTDEFEILDFLGRGKFGEVKRCSEITSGKEFAAKFICAPRPQDKKDVVHEVDIMKKLQHKRLIQLYDAYETKSEMCLVLEIIYGGELFDRVISEDFVLTEKSCKCFVRQICEGVLYMHQKNIIHLDMKPENILCLTKTGNRIKIIDFGLAREYDPHKDLRVLFGTPEFMAPEVVQYDPINFSTDMWSIGVICYVLLSGLSPFMGDNDGETLTNVIKGQYDFCYAEFDEVSEDAKDLISKLLVRDKNARLTAEQTLDHPWLCREAGPSLPTSPEPVSPALDLSKRRLKRFVYRRKWQKIVNAIIALKRMGVTLQTLRRSSVDKVRPPEVNSVNSWDRTPPRSPRSPAKPDGAAGFDYSAPKTTPPSPKIVTPDHKTDDPAKPPRSPNDKPKPERKEPQNEEITTDNNALGPCKIKPKRDSTRRKLKAKAPEVEIERNGPNLSKQNGVVSSGENEQTNNKLNKDNKNVNDSLAPSGKQRKASPRRAGKNSPVITPEVEKRSNKLEEKSTKDSGIIMDDFDQIQNDLKQIQSNITEMEESLGKPSDVKPKTKDVNSKVVTQKPPKSSAPKPVIPKKPAIDSSVLPSTTSKASSSATASKSGGKEKEKSESTLSGTLRRKKQGLQNHMRALVSKFESR